MSEVQDTIAQDPDYKSNAMAWMANQIYNQAGKQVRLLYPEHQRVTEILDAVKSKDFGKLKEKASIVGLKLTRNMNAQGLGQPEFNLLEAAAVYDAEPLVRSAVTRQMNLWFKEGFHFVGINPRLTKYIERRFKQIAYVTKLPTLELFKQITRSLLKYSNAFIIKRRDANLSGGVRKEDNGNRVPIAGYFPVSPVNMFPFYKDGKLIEWVRFVDDGTRMQRYKPDDVIHLQFDLEEDFLFGKPRTMGVAEDVAALRRIEENVEILIAKFLFPVYHFVVGTPEMPARYYNDGTSEIDLAKVMLQNMEQEGMLITSERFSMDVVQAFKESLDAIEYLKHFKTRLYTGLGVSAVDMGEGDTANRSTADNISQNLKDRVIEDQRTFASMIQHHFFIDLFMEHPEEVSALNSFDQVKLAFANVDLDNRLKLENHIIQLWNSDLIDQDEAREEIHRLPMDPDAPTRFKLIEGPLAMIAAVDESFSETKAAKILGIEPSQAKSAGRPPGGGASSSERKAKNPVATKARPENQFGKALGPTKRKSSVEQRLLGNKLLDVLNDVVSSKDENEIVSVVERHFTDPEDRKTILSHIEEALRDSGSLVTIRAHLVPRFMGLAYKFSD